MLVTLGENGVKTLDDLADLAGDELRRDRAATGRRSTSDDANAHDHGRARALVRRRGRAGAGVAWNARHLPYAETPTDEAADGGKRRGAAAPLHRDRRSRDAPDALMRFVVGPDGAVVPDIDERLPGRGLWLTPRAI